MSYISSAVYTPPSSGLPFVAVVFDQNGEVLVARAVPSIKSGEALLESVFSEFSQKNSVNITRR